MFFVIENVVSKFNLLVIVDRPPHLSAPGIDRMGSGLKEGLLRRYQHFKSRKICPVSKPRGGKARREFKKMLSQGHIEVEDASIGKWIGESRPWKRIEKIQRRKNLPKQKNKGGNQSWK